MDTKAEKCLTHKVRVMMEKGLIQFFPFSWCFGLVDMTVKSEVFTEQETLLTVREDNWNGGPAGCVAQELAQMLADGKLRFMPIKGE